MKSLSKILTATGFPNSSGEHLPDKQAKTIPLLKEIRPGIQKETIQSENISICMKGKIEILSLKEICFIKAESNYIRIVMENGKIHLVAKTLKAVAIRLIPKGFIRVHHSYLVHPRQFQQFNFQDATLLLQSSHEVPVSRTGHKMVIQYLNSLSI